MDKLLEVSNVSFSYNGALALKNISFSLNKGEALALTGPSGSGKTTLLKLAGQMLKPQSGQITNYALAPAYVSQESSLLAWKTVLENICLPFVLRGQKITETINRQANEALQQVGLARYASAYPPQLSGGMKKRVELARALASKPDLILLDEPFSALDAPARERLNVLCARINQNLGAALVLVTHDINEACYLASHIVLLAGKPAQTVKESFVNLKGNGQQSFSLNPEAEKTAKELRAALNEAWKPEDEAVPVKKQPFSFKNPLKRAAEAVLRLGLFLVLASALKRFGRLSDLILPYPQTVAKTFFKTLFDGSILPHIQATVTASLGGFFIALLLALPLGYLMNRFAALKRLILPFILAANAVPIVALAPFLVLWFGLGLAPKLAAAGLLVFLPMLVASSQAFEISFKETSVQLFFFKPKALRGFFTLQLPAAAPIIFAGIKVSIAYSVIGAVVGEFVAGSVGLGSLVSIARANFDTAMMFAALTWLVILGLAYYNLAQLVEKVLIKNARNE